jgi:hypothetical protein
MRHLVVGVALACLIAGAAPGPLAAAGGGDDPRHESAPILTPSLSWAGGTATFRTGSSSPSETSARALAAVLGTLLLPRPKAATALAATVASVLASCLKLPHPQRGPPSSLA